MRFKRILGLLFAAAIVVEIAGPAQENPIPPAPANLTVDQIVERMQGHDQSQRERLKHYEALRHYQVEYKGFAANLSGKMDVEVTYDAGSGKTFRIVSQSGSKLLCDKVLKRAVDSELEASRDPSSTALTAANYNFKLAGMGSVEGRAAYILEVTPLKESKFLYRGKIWVDAADFAVAKIEAEPAKNPSFWIARTTIHHTSAKTGGYWLPRQNRSETKVRVGGAAVLTIDYGTYTVAP